MADRSHSSALLLCRGGFSGSFGLLRDVVIAGGERIGETERSHRGRQRGQGTLDQGRRRTAADQAPDRPRVLGQHRSRAGADDDADGGAGKPGDQGERHPEDGLGPAGGGMIFGLWA